MRTLRLLFTCLALAVAARPAGAQLLQGLLTTPVCVTVPPLLAGNELTAALELPGGLAGSLSVVFEDVAGLEPGALSISACAVNPLSSSLRSRLGSSWTGIALGFPVLLRIGPAPGSSLAFHGTYDLSVYTTLLSLLPASPLRLFKAPDGGPFRDMTGYLEAGSLRAGGTGSSFSEFLVVTDLRSVDAVIGQKLDDLDATLDAARGVVPPGVHADLVARVTAIRVLVSSGQIAVASSTTASFSTFVESESGTSIPDLWQAGSAVVNVAGTLRAQADTLRFSLERKLAWGL